MISLRNVSLVYPNGVRALDNVSLEIAKGDFVFLVGHSGTGKSSLLRLLYREARPSRRRNHRRRHPRRPLATQRAFRRCAAISGVVFQDFKLLIDKTVWENVAFAMQVTGAHTRDVMRQVPRVLDLVGLSHKSRMYPGELSGGEQQRTRDRAGAREQSEDSALRRTDGKPRSDEHDRKSWSCCCASTSRERPSSSRPTTRPSSIACAAASCAWKTAESSPTKNEGYYYLGLGQDQILSG